MKKAIFGIFGLALLLMLTLGANAQKLPFTKKKSFLTIGYGYPYTYNANFKSVERYTNEQGGVYSSSSIGPIIVNYEYAIKSKLGIGAGLSYASSDYSALVDGEMSSYTTQRLGFVFRMGWHPIKKKAWDPYLTGNIGYNVEMGSGFENPEQFEGLRIPPPPDIIYNVALGIRYFKPESSVGFYFEAGYSNMCLLQGGIAFRFGPTREEYSEVW